MVITGRMVLVAAIAALVVLVRPDWTVVTLWVVAMVLLWGIDAMRATRPSELHISRDGATSVRASEPAELQLRLTNNSNKTFRGTVRDAWPPSLEMTPSRHLAALEPQGRRSLSSRVRSSRRGTRSPDRVTVRSLGPWRLSGWQQSRQLPWRIDVLPAFDSRRHLPSKLAQLRDLEGRSVVLHRGQGTEFDSLREYVGGDDVRSIDWRATARASDVMVRTWRPERDRHVVIVLDCGRTSAGRVGDAPRLDASIEATLLLTALAARAGDRIDVLAWDRGIRGAAHGRADGEALRSTTSMLAHVQPSLLETDWDALQIEIARRARQRSLVVLLSSLDPAPVRSGLLPVIPQLTRRHLVMIGAVSDPSVTEMLRARSYLSTTYRAAAAAGFTTERRSVGTELVHRRVEVVDAPPEQLAPALADRYLALKAAGRL
ncbi:MAG: DUF58 domain-containing protein [Actinomycetes bacterium]